MKNNNKKGIDLNQYDVFLAIDWSQDNVAIAHMRKNGSNPKVEQMPAKIGEVRKYLLGINGRRKVLTIEETTSTHWLYVELFDTVDRILVCDPYRNALLQSGPKNDRIDALKLCELLRGNFLHEVHHSLDEDYKIRKLTSAYEDVIKAGVRLKNQQSAIFRAEGLRYKEDELPKDNHILKFIEGKQNQAIDLYEEQREEYQELFNKIIKDNKKIKNLLKIPGIGEIFAIQIYGIVIQVGRFKDKNKFWGYCGLALNQKESGKKNYGARTPRCSRKLRGIFISAARSAIGGNNDMAEYYNYLLQSGLPERESRKSVARYIAKSSYVMLKKEVEYVPFKWRKTSEKIEEESIK